MAATDFPKKKSRMSAVRDTQLQGILIAVIGNKKKNILLMFILTSDRF